MKFFKNQALKTISMFALSIIILIGAVLPMSAAGSSVDEYMATYTVKTGDTLSSIAAKYGVTVSSIVKENDISASSTLFAGQVLYIPGATSVEEDSTTSFGSSSLMLTCCSFYILTINRQTGFFSTFNFTWINT